MSYCLNPACQNPQNADRTQFCLSCGSKLLLRERYRAIKPLGRGGFGRTFLAIDEDKPSKPRCAIKQFFPLSQGTSSAEKAAELFNREAVRLDELGKHPQIPELLAHFQQESYQYLVQEFIEGQIGAAKVVEGSRQTGTVIGSPEFVAPEQIRGQAVFASDLYSLGVTCIYLLTQVSPFDLFDINQDTWVWRDFLKVQIDPKLGRILDKMIEPSLSRRYKSVAEVLQDLPPQQSAGAGTGTPPQSAPAISVPQRMPVVQNPLPPTVAGTIIPVPPLQRVVPAHAPTWRCVHTLVGHSRAVMSVAFSPDGQTLASGSEDKTIEMWKLDAGKRWYTLTGHSDWVTCVAFCPDGRTLASSSRDKTIQIWDLNKGKWWYALRGHSDRVSAVAFSPNGQVLASSSRDKTVQLWNLNKGRWMSTLTGHAEGVEAVAFSAGGEFLASASRDKTVRLWDFSRAWGLGAIDCFCFDFLYLSAFWPDPPQPPLGKGGSRRRIDFG